MLITNSITPQQWFIAVMRWMYILLYAVHIVACMRMYMLLKAFCLDIKLKIFKIAFVQLHNKTDFIAPFVYRYTVFSKITSFIISLKFEVVIHFMNLRCVNSRLFSVLLLCYCRLPYIQIQWLTNLLRVVFIYYCVLIVLLSERQVLSCWLDISRSTRPLQLVSG